MPSSWAFYVSQNKGSSTFFASTYDAQMFREGPGSDFCNYFLAFPTGFPKSATTKEQKSDASSGREGILELCWNHGTGPSYLTSAIYIKETDGILYMSENDDNFKYESGNEQPHRGFGHICVSVDNLDAACKRFDEMGVKFKKRPEEGRMRVGYFENLDSPGFESWILMSGD